MHKQQGQSVFRIALAYPHSAKAELIPRKRSLIPRRRNTHCAKAELIAGEDPQSTPSYTFTAKTTDYASRFRLVFSSGVAGEAACEPAAGVYVLRLIDRNGVKVQKIVIE